MKALASKPQTPGDRLRRAIAIVLDDAFIASVPNGGHPRFILNGYQSFDALVEVLAEAAQRNPVPHSLHSDEDAHWELAGGTTQEQNEARFA